MAKLKAAVQRNIIIPEVVGKVFCSIWMAIRTKNKNIHASTQECASSALFKKYMYSPLNILIKLHAAGGEKRCKDKDKKLMF